MARMLLALAALVAACSSDGYEVVVATGGTDALADGATWELAIERDDCELGAATGQAPSPDRVVRTLSWSAGESGPEVGDLDPGRYAFYLRVRDGACAVRWAGCTAFRAEAGGDARITIALADVAGPGCEDLDPCTIETCDASGACGHEPDLGDADGDGFGCGDDCDDEDDAVSPAAAEQCNGRDDDCDEDVDEGACGDSDDHCTQQSLEGGTFLLCTTPRSWTTARDRCVGHDAVLTTVEVQESTLDLIEQVEGAFPERVWIGMNDRNDEGSFVDEIEGDVGFTQWAAGEPDGGEADDCVLFSVPGRGWEDADCTEEFPFVCKLP